ncbi:MAG TPA: LamG-like jellyroll fold domain-containing protein [Verrucomicrobiae bacterium]
MATAIFLSSGQMFLAVGQNAAPAEQIKAKWTKALTEAVQEFQNNNDQESADFVSGILASLDRPGGMAPGALAANGQHMKDRVRQLVRHGALESAAILNWEQWRVLNAPGPGLSGPANPNHKIGGTPGSGGLVLYLPFDKPDDNGAVHDESGAGNDGHVFGAQWVSNGKYGGAYQFHITNLTDRIVIPNSDTLNSDNITIAAWIKAADSDGFWNRIADKDFRNAYCLDLGGDYNGKGPRGKLQFETSQGSIGSDRPLNDDQWHHVAACFDGNAVHCYIDGVEKGHPVKNAGPLKKSTWDLCIGNSVVDYGTGEFLAYDGLIDEVRIYNRALSSAEIKALFNATSADINVATPPPDNSAKPDAAERLKKVKALYDQGLINKDDYDKKVKEIMDSL